MRLPFIILSRVNHEWREKLRAGHLNALDEAIRMKDVVFESQRRQITSLEYTISDGRAHNAKLIEALHTEQASGRNASLQLQAQAAQFAGDLQLERQRFDDFVRDMLEKVISPARATPAPLRSSPQGRQLPNEVQDAIDAISGTDEILRRQQEDEAWRRLDAKPELKPDALATLIRQGDRP